jgi:hypothetical protein
MGLIYSHKKINDNMFTTKKTTLFEVPVKSTKATNPLVKSTVKPLFVQAAQKISVETRSGNGAET